MTHSEAHNENTFFLKENILFSSQLTVLKHTFFGGKFLFDRKIKKNKKKT